MFKQANFFNYFFILNSLYLECVFWIYEWGHQVLRNQGLPLHGVFHIILCYLRIYLFQGLCCNVEYVHYFLLEQWLDGIFLLFHVMPSIFWIHRFRFVGSYHLNQINYLNIRSSHLFNFSYSDMSIDLHLTTFRISYYLDSIHPIISRMSYSLAIRRPLISHISYSLANRHPLVSHIY